MSAGCGLNRGGVEGFDDCAGFAVSLVGAAAGRDSRPAAFRNLHAALKLAVYRDSGRVMPNLFRDVERSTIEDSVTAQARES